MLAMSPTVTGTTAARTVRQDRCVRLIERMPELAVRLGAVSAVGSVRARSRFLLLARYSAARSAKTSAGLRDPSILGRVFVAVVTVSATGKLRSNIGAAKNVLLRSDWLEVSGVNAQRVVAKVIEMLRHRERAVDLFPKPPMPRSASIVMARSKGGISPAVAFPDPRCPNPASSQFWRVPRDRSMLVDLLPEPLVRIAFCRHNPLCTTS